MSKRRMKYHSNNEISYYNFLHSMKDKIVTVYRGGPESKQGKLVAVKSDYIALQVEKKIIYYQLDHVKSITEDTNNSTTTLETEEMADADDFHSLIGQLMNQFVQLNQGGPESKKGCLVWLGDDYAALNTNEDGVVYFNIHHIKSISKHESDLKMEEQTPADDLEVLEADYLSEVFKSLTHKWVSINRGGPEAIEGILVDNADGHYTLVKNQEVLRIYPFHIKSISLGPKGSYKKEDKKKEHDDQEDNKDSDQKQEEVYSSSLRSSKPYRSSKSSKRSLRSSDYQSSKSHHSSGSKSSSKSSKRSPRSSDYQSSQSHHSSGSKSSSKSSKRSPRSSGYQSSQSHRSSGSKSSSKSSKRSPRSSDYQSSKSSGFYGSSSSFESSGGQKEEYSYETIVKTIDYHWKRKF